MGITIVLLIVTQLAVLSDCSYVHNPILAQLWTIQQRWCVPRHLSCINKNQAAGQNPLEYVCGNQPENLNTSDYNDTSHGNHSWLAAMATIPACCGGCSCESDCDEYGTCCLSEYKSFTYGKKMLKTAANRYKCVRPQLLETEDLTDFVYDGDFPSVFMVSKCTSSYDGEYTRASCENPGPELSLDTVLPVTDYGQHYRNIYCARCNGIMDGDALPRWGLKLYCMQYLKLKEYDLLQNVARHRCNIFFISPPNVRYPRECKPQTYTVSQCNVTGLWPRHNNTIASACDAYVDVFNGTYKNIFCYFCNTNTSYEGCSMDLSSCVGMKSSFISPKPLFTTKLYRNSLESTDPTGDCIPTTQFYDRKMDVCRSIICDSNRQLDENTHQCALRWQTSDPPCYVMYIKLTPEYQATYTVDMLYWREMPERVDDILGKDRDKLIVSNIYFKTMKQRNQEFIVYYVMELSVELDKNYGVDVLSLLIYKLHNRWHIITEDFKLLSEFVLATRLPNDTTEGISILAPYHLAIRDHDTGLFKVILGENHTTRLNDRRLCNNTEPILMDRLHVCSYIRLNFTEMNFELLNTNNILKISDHFGNGQMILPEWEFRIVNDSVLMCLSKYLEFYNSILVMPPTGAIETRYSVCIFLLCTMISLLMTRR